MSGNTFGRLFRLTTYGESHGPALGGVVDGCPAGIALSEELLQKELDRRRPGGGTAGTTRRADAVRLLSGVLKARPRERPSASKSRTPTSAPAITGRWRRSGVRGTRI